MIDWSKLSPEQFEELCVELLELNDFSNIEWYGQGGGDKGRDIVATKIDEPLPRIKKERKWIIQCKRYAKKRITKAELNDFLVAAKEHDPDVALLMLTGTLTSDVRDWIATVRKDYSFDVFVWERRDLENEVRRNLTRLSQKPAFIPQSDEPALVYELDLSYRVYMCNEVEEVGFFLMNSYNKERDIQGIKGFVDFIRNNEITFNDEDEDNGAG